MQDPFLQNFPLQNLKRTDLLNSSQWVVRDGGNMESTLINPPVCSTGQVPFTQLMTGQVTVPTLKFIAYIEVSLPWNMVSLRTNYILMVKVH